MHVRVFASLVFCAILAAVIAGPGADETVVAAQSIREAICHVGAGGQTGRILWLPAVAREAHARHGDSTEFVSYADGTCVPICSPAFDPRSLAGLELWFTADTLSSTLNDGDRVSFWQDSSGNARFGSQAEAARQPVFRSGMFNGHAAVDFDGIDDVLDLEGTTRILTSVSMFIVYVYDTAEISEDISRTYPFTLGGSVDVTGGYYGIETLNPAADSSVDVADIFAGFGNDARATFPRISAAGQLNVLSAVTATTIHTTIVHVNGLPAAMSYTGSDIELQVPLSGPAGSSWSGIGGSRYPGDENFADATIAEVLVYSNALSDTARRQVECYLKSKYGVF